jgi:hypothetical protein
MQLGTAYLIRTHTFGVWQLSLRAYSTYSVILPYSPRQILLLSSMTEICMVYFLFLKAGPASSGFGLHFIVDCVVNETPSKRNVSCMTHNLVHLTCCLIVRPESIQYLNQHRTIACITVCLALANVRKYSLWCFYMGLQWTACTRAIGDSGAHHRFQM